WRNVVAAQLGNNPYLADSLLIMATLPTVVALILLGKKLEGSNPLPGARAGAFVLAFLLFLWMLTTLGIGNNWIASNRGLEPGVGMGITIAVGGGLLFLLWLIIKKPGFGRYLVGLEHSGWFHATSFKPNQGLRVRRGTVIGLLAIGICGIWTMISHHMLGT